MDHALKNGWVDAVYTLAYPSGGGAGNENTERPRVIPTGQEVEGKWWTVFPGMARIPCSIYRPILWGKGLAAVDPRWRRVLLVGLPCQIKGAKALLQLQQPSLEVLSVALFCRQQKTLDFSRRILRMFEAPEPASIFTLTYRGEGWPGTVRRMPGQSSSDREVPFLKTGFAFGASLWTLPACDFCASPCASFSADVCLADPWNLIEPGMDPQGSNIILAWTDTGRRLLESAQPDVRIHELPAEEVHRMMDFRRIRGKVADIRVRLNRESPTQDYLRRERRRARQERIFWYLHPEGWLWRAYAEPLWRVRGLISGVIGLCKRGLCRLTARGSGG